MQHGRLDLKRAIITIITGGLLATGNPMPVHGHTSVAGTPAGIVSNASGSAPTSDESALRVGVVALAGAIAAVGQTPELSTPLPFTETSIAELLQLDQSLAGDLTSALQGTDLEEALGRIEGVTLVEDGDEATLAFRYDRTVRTDLALVHDDGDLRFGANDGAGQVRVSLRTDEAAPFVVAVDTSQEDPLLRVALVSQPRLRLDVDIATDSLPPFEARQGFTAVEVTGGRYRIDRSQEIVLRDPDGRGLLTLEDLRYSTLPDLFRITTVADALDVSLDLQLPDSLTGGTAPERRGTLSLSADDVPPGVVWPAAADARRSYGSAMSQATGLSMVDGLTSLAQYTGTVLALQDASDVRFPNLAGGTSDLFSPGDRLLALLTTSASAQMACGAAPGNPPTGVAAPGDTIYCQATTAPGLGDLTDITWTLNDGGTIVTAPDQALGEAPTALVEIRDSDGEPDLEVSFTAEQQQMTARTMPRTVQDVVLRIGQFAQSSATASLDEDRLDVAVEILQDAGSRALDVGDPQTLGALVGLTGLRAPDSQSPAQSPVRSPAQGQARATGASFDVGFGIQTGAMPDGVARETFLLPADGTLLEIAGLSAAPPTTVRGLLARIGFLQVEADLTGLALGTDGTGPAVELERTTSGAATDPLPISDLLTESGAVDPDQLRLTSRVTASIAFTATEQPVNGSTFATGGTLGATGSATVSWPSTGAPTVRFGGEYSALRVFDPVPAAFLGGTAVVETAADGLQSARVVISSLPTGTTLYDALNVAPGTRDVEVSRRLIGDGVACQNVTVQAATTLTCEGLAPNGTSPWTDGDSVEVIVLGDPFALRDSVIEGLSISLSEFDRLSADNVSETPGLAFDQYTSSLPLVDLTPAQLAVERDALGQGLSAIARAATEDEGSGSTTPVSSAQELALSVDDLVRLGSDSGFEPALEFGLASDSLEVRLTASTPQTFTLRAPLRFDDLGTAEAPGRGQVRSGTTAAGSATLPVEVDSTTTLGITVDRVSARPTMAESTATESTARLDLGEDELAGHPLQAGVAELAVGPEGGSAGLGVTVRTGYTVGAGGIGALQTRRSSAQPSGRAATARLEVAPGDVITYAADATDSSGGAGATQPAPDPMQVRYLAEGIDGLAAALGAAMDGSAPRNLNASGEPVSAPLIGTDLDAGAEVSDILTGLTRQLRTALREDAVRDAPDAASLRALLDDAVAAAVDDTPGLMPIDAADVDVEVTCGGTGGACTPCPPTSTDGSTTSACRTDSNTGWNEVTVSLKLQGRQKSGEPEFRTGLAGLEVRSNKTIETTTEWRLPVTLRLTRGVGPQVIIADGDALEIDVVAALPAGGIDAIVGYLPAHLSAAESDGDGTIETTVRIEPTPRTYDLFDLYDGELTTRPSFVQTDGGPDEDGLDLAFRTLGPSEGVNGVFGLKGTIDIPWTPAGFEEDVTYNDVTLAMGDVIASIATPFQVIDPYLAPVRDVVDVLRTPLPVISDLSELGGGDEVTLLSLLETISKATKKPQLDLAHRVIGLVGGVAELNGAVAQLAKNDVPLADLEGLGTVLSLDPSEVTLREKCTQSITTSTTVTPPTGPATTTTVKKAPEPCPDADDLQADEGKTGAADQTTQDNRKGKRSVKEKVSETTSEVTGNLPGFSLPFLADPDQLMDTLTGEGEASYFRLDMGSLTASVAYTQKFGPIMAGPVPIVPFVGGSISVEGRLALGFDSYAQTLAAQSVAAGDIDGLVSAYGTFDGKDAIREGFYVDDLDAEGVDVPEVKIVTTLEAGAGVSIGIVTAGLKGGLQLTINLDLDDPSGDGRLRTAEIRDRFANDPACIFEVDADLGAYISVFLEIELLFTSLEYEFDLLRLGPYSLFTYGCPSVTPTLVIKNPGGTGLQLTSGAFSSQRLPGGTGPADAPDDFEVRQFATRPDLTVYEISGFGRTQTVDVTYVPADPAVPSSVDTWRTRIYKSGITTSTEIDPAHPAFTTTSPPTFAADGGAGQDRISFLAGEDFAEDGAGELTLRTTPFDTVVSQLTGGPEDDVLVTGSGDDYGIDGGAGNDAIDVGEGDDVVTGGPGDDNIGAGSGRDDVRGGAGNDRLEGGAGADRVDGETGDDSLVGGPGRDVRAVLVQPRGTTADVVTEQVRLGFDSGDVLVGGPGSDTVDGGDGSDVVIGGPAPALTQPSVPLDSLFETGERRVGVLVQGATDVDPVSYDSRTVSVLTAKVPSASRLDTLCQSGETLTGTSSADFVTGGAEHDIVIGGNGPDTLDGGSGPDELCGLAGDDELSGDGAATDAPSVDAAETSQDDDIIRGGAGDDRADGGLGDDVMFGDDVSLVRDGARILDGSTGDTGRGSGDDFLDGGEGDDVVAGGDGADLLVGGHGDDRTYGEARDTDALGGAAPPLAQRLVACNSTTRVLGGLVDLDGDLLAGAGSNDGVTADDGRLAGLRVIGGVLTSPTTGANLTGLVAGTYVVVDGRVDLDRDGDIDADDTGTMASASMLGSSTNGAGDCILAGEGNDELRGGSGSDYLGAGDGVDLLDGGDGNDLALGDAGTDVVLGGPHHDVLVGGTGSDHLLGGDGDDRLRGNEGDDDLVGGSDLSGAVDGQDVLFGGRGEDVLVAENGAAVSEAIVASVSDPSVPWAQIGLTPATVTATSGSPLVFDSSALVCRTGPATRYLTVLADDGTVGEPEASPGTELAYDELYGGFDCDFVFGSPGDDLVRGGQGDDVVEGGPGDDIGYGDEGDDVVLGGSSLDQSVDTRVTRERDGAGLPDGADRIRGDGGPDGESGADLLVGDSALPIRMEELGSRAGYEGPSYVVQLHDAGDVGSLPPVTVSGADTIRGDGGIDRIFGQGGSDTLAGDDGDDYLEGGDGGDDLTGDDGHDDLIGGSSGTDGLPLGGLGERLFTPFTGPFPVLASGILDRGEDTLDGGAGDDVVLGDSGRITRPSAQAVLSGTPRTRADGTTLRWIRLFDLVTADNAEVTSSGGDDTLRGGSGRDLMFGQAGDDTASGGSDDDYVEGNSGDDVLRGDGGHDDLIGGGSSNDGVMITGAGTRVVDRLLSAAGGATDRSSSGLVDGNDELEGGDAGDVLLGDNGRVTRAAPGVVVLGGGSGPQPARQVSMSDETPGIWAGSDSLSGGAGDDDLYGQFDNTLTSRDKQSFLGTRVQGDILDGGSGDDALIGDQGVDVPTPASALGAVGRTLTDRSRFLRERVRPRSSLVRVVTLTQSSLGGDDLLLGGAGSDSVHAGAGRDVANAGPDDDVVFAGDGADALWGGTGHDRLFGGAGSDLLDIKRRTFDPALWQVAAPTEDTDRRRRTTNGRDVLFGGAGPDALQADHGDQGTSRRGQGDRLIDWLEGSNFFKICRSGSGRGKVFDKPSSSMISTLRALAAATGSVGSAELAIPGPERSTPYPQQGSFRCEN